MFAWLKNLFEREPEDKRFTSVAEEFGFLAAYLWSQEGLEAYERARSPLKEKNESIAHELVAASHAKDEENARAIGKQLNSGGGIQRMKLLCYRVRHLGGDDRWLEMIWSGIGNWDG